MKSLSSDIVEKRPLRGDWVSMAYMVLSTLTLNLRPVTSLMNVSTFMVARDALTPAAVTVPEYRERPSLQRKKEHSCEKSILRDGLSFMMNSAFVVPII